jgi:hypothetical protein
LRVLENRVLRRRKWGETGEDCKMKRCTKYYGDQMKDEMGGACSTHGRDYIQNFDR